MVKAWTSLGADAVGNGLGHGYCGKWVRSGTTLFLLARARSGTWMRSGLDVILVWCMDGCWIWIWMRSGMDGVCGLYIYIYMFQCSTGTWMSAFPRRKAPAPNPVCHIVEMQV